MKRRFAPLHRRVARWQPPRWLHRLLWLTALLTTAVPGSLAQDKFIAYAVPAGTVGNQAFSGTLGMEFDVNNAVIVTRFGVFDDNSDGLKLPITARLYDRATDPPTEMLSMEFTPESPGELVGGSRFKPLSTPLRLEAGFRGTIVAEGYGAEERLKNAQGVLANATWTLQDGNGSLQFVGTSRYGVNPGEYPGSIDSGPAARYAAGTFEYQTTPAVLPGKPVISLKPGDRQITVAWPAVIQPAPATMYRVQRGSSSAGPFTQIAETSQTTYADQSLANGTLYYYVVRGVTASGKVGPDSDPKCASPYTPIAANHLIAYLVPATLAGNQAYAGSLGMEFDVQNPIIVKRLGVFDDRSDGLKLPLTARIYNRDTVEVLAEVAFTPEEPGVPIEGMRFKPLPQPLRLDTGFKGLIQADGYGPEEKLNNAGGVAAQAVWTLNDGNGSLLFVGASRYGATPGEYPATADSGPAARYAAGTFEYEITPPQKPGTPVVRVQPAEDAAATLEWDPILKPLPAAKFQVFRATAVDGPFNQVAEVTTTSYRDTGLANGTQVFYKVRAVAVGAVVGNDSNIVSVTPNPRRAGVAYINPANKDGNQAFGGSLGMDFNVIRPIRITKLGVFDENSDGLNLPLTAAVFDRQTRQALVTLAFSPENPGELIEGSRFKPLPQPLVLAAGFQGTMVAYGYGAAERLFNTGNRPADVAQLQTFDGGSLVFVGTSRFLSAPGPFPTSLDSGPANRYAAGTFYFEPLVEQPKLSISVASGKVKIVWTGGGVLEKAPDITGPWATEGGASSGVEITPTGNRQFYRVKL